MKKHKTEEPMDTIITYKCPACDAELKYSGASEKMTCEYCGSTFDAESVKAYNETLSAKQEAPQEEIREEYSEEHTEWSEEELNELGMLTCPTCGGELIFEANTAASSCPYCGNPTMVRKNLSGVFRPDLVLPFRKTKEEAKRALADFAKKKILLPKTFAAENRLEEIKGIYLPFWLYSCHADANASYTATRVFTSYTSTHKIIRTDFYTLTRAGVMDFDSLPVDGSSKIDDALMDSIEPFDFAQAEEFSAAYLSGFLADKYDEDSEICSPRARERITNTAVSVLRGTVSGYATVTPKSSNVSVKDTTVRYALLPVWLLVTNYRGKKYTFAMNGQTGKFVGELPVCRARFWGWTLGIGALLSALLTAGYCLLML